MQIHSQRPDARPTPHWAWYLLALLPMLAALGFDAAGPRPRAVATDNKFKGADKNGDGSLTREEFATTKQKKAKKPACKC